MPPLDIDIISMLLPMPPPIPLLMGLSPLPGTVILPVSSPPG
jgi:hypothetical protein